jgi:hypothetical protein
MDNPHPKKPRGRNSSNSLKDDLAKMLDNFERIQRFSRLDEGRGALVIEGLRCIGLREFIKIEFGDNMHEVYMKPDHEQKFAIRVFECELGPDAHTHDISMATMLRVSGLEPIVCEYPVGMDDSIVMFGKDLRVLVGLVDMIAYDSKRKSIAVCEVKTFKSTEDYLPLPLLAVYQVYLASRLLQLASANTLKNISMYVLARNKRKRVCWEITHVPEAHRLDRHFIAK